MIRYQNIKLYNNLKFSLTVVEICKRSVLLIYVAKSDSDREFLFLAHQSNVEDKKTYYQTRNRKTATKRSTLKHEQFEASFVTHQKQ